MIDPVLAACAGVSLVAALMVVTRKHPVYCAMWLLVAFLAFAVIFFRLGATFLGAIHILVYAGAILVLFLFVVMLLNLKPEELGTEMGRPAKGAMLLCVLTVAVGLALTGHEQWVREGQSDGTGPKAMSLDVGAEPGPFACDVHPAVRSAEEIQCPACRKDGRKRNLVREDWGGVSHVGRALFQRYAFPFEILSALILAAVFGGVVLAKRNL